MQRAGTTAFSGDVRRWARRQKIREDAPLGGVTFSCPAFGQMDPDSVKGAYVYAVSVGDFGYPKSPVMDQLYADIWGSAFTDAVRFLMMEAFAVDNRLSDSFGPGFYGMDVGEMEKIGTLLDFSTIGIHEAPKRGWNGNQAGL